MSESESTAQLRAGVGTPIAELNPELQDIQKRVIRGEITVFWPYSPLRDVVAFILAEPDFRLRRDKGTVRVEFAGASAKAVVDLGLGGGDEVTLSLDGVAWAERDTRMPVVGTPLAWQLRFSNKLLAQVVLVADEETKLLNVDQLPEEARDSTPQLAAVSAAILDDIPERTISPARDATPEITLPTKRPAEGSLEPGEFASPAFLKRARMSYGSLFEGGTDIFDDDGGAKGKGRKRNKTSRFSSSWRYASRSPTPEIGESVNGSERDEPMVDEKTETPLKQFPMVDGGCQTDELDFTPPHHVDVVGEPRIGSSQAFDTPSRLPPDAHIAIPSSVLQGGLVDSPAVNGQFAPVHQPDFAPLQPTFNAPDFGHPHSNQQYPHELGHSPDGLFATQEHFPLDSFPNPTIAHATQSPHEYPTGGEAPHFVSQAESYHSLSHGQTSQAGDYQHDSPHHTVFVDRIVEPPQSSWGFTSGSTSYPDPPGENPVPAVIDVPSSPHLRSNPASLDGMGDEDRDDQVNESDRANANPAESIGEVERAENQDQDGTEEGYGAQTYSERHFQPSNAQSYATSRNEAVSSENGDDADELDAGGDYDIAQYRNQSNVQDDDEGSDFESDFGQEGEEEIYNPRESDLEEDQLDQDVEDFEDEEYSEEEAPAAPAAPKPKGPPEVIDLLSDSDDDDDNLPVQQPPARSADPPLPQCDGSADETGSSSGEEGEEGEETDTSEDESTSQASQVASEQGGSDVESEAEERPASEEVESSPLLVAVPEDRRETTDLPAGSSPFLEDALESMSPIRPLQVTGLMQKDGSVIDEEDTSDAAQLEAELEMEIQHTIQEDLAPTTELRTSEVLVLEETMHLHTVESKVLEPDANTMDTAPDDPIASTAQDEVHEGDVEMEDQPQLPMIPATSLPEEVSGNTERDLDSVTEATDGVPFFSARAVMEHPDAVEDTDGSKAASSLPIPVNEHKSNPQADNPVAKTSGVDHSVTRPLGRGGRHVWPAEPQPPVSDDIPELNRPAYLNEGLSKADAEARSPDTRETETRASQPERSSSQPIAVDEAPETNHKENHDMEDASKTTPDVSAVDGSDTVMEHENAQLPTPLDTQQQEPTKQNAEEPPSVAQSSPEAPSVIITSSAEDGAKNEEDGDEEQTTSHPPVEELAAEGKSESPAVTGHRPETRSQTGHLPPDAGHSSPAAPGSTQAESRDPHTPSKEIDNRPETRSQSRPQSLEPDTSSPQMVEVPAPAPKEERVEETPVAKTRSQRKRRQSKPKADEDQHEGDPSVKLARASAANKQKNDQEDDPSVKLARASIASRRSTRLSDRQPTPDTARVTRAACHSLQKSATPEVEEDSSLQLAKAALNSPSRTAKERAEEHSPTAIKLKLNRSLRSDVPDCISLKVLRQQPPGKTVDILAIATTEPPSAKRAKGGPKGMMLAFSIADHSIAATQPVLVHIFRVQKSALPTVHPGEAVLLRQFNVTNIQGKLGLRSTDASSWAVFEGEPDDERPPQIVGPPMELSAGDKSFAVLIKKWYHSLEEATKAKWNKAGEKALGAGEDSK